MSFTHLHVHSNFTFGEGAASIDDLLSAAKNIKTKALALTDKNGLYGAIRFYQKARKEKIKPIIGVELKTESGYPIVLLAKNKNGYENLCRIISEMYLGSEDEPLCTFNLLSKYSKDVFALSGPKGELAAYLLLGRSELAKRSCLRYIHIFGKDNFIIELQNHLLPQEKIINQALFDLSSKLGLLVVATNDVHYARPEDYDMHRTLVRASRVVHHRDIRPTSNDEYYLKSDLQMARMFCQYPAALQNANLIAEECNLILDLGKIHSPCFPLPKHEKADECLLKLCLKALPKKYRMPDKKISSRLVRELATIRKKRFSSYFLLVRDIVLFARKEGIRCSCRGSASGSLVAYLLDISQVDPIRYGLLFERFLNPERQDFPDIDLDFDSRRRDEITEYVLKKYKNKAALVATIPTFQARSAVRELARTLGLSYEKIENLTDTLPYISADKIRYSLKALPELEGSELRLEKFRGLLDSCEKVNGFPRHLSTHLGGVVISDVPLKEVVPIQKSAKGFPLAQYDKDDLETLGLIKIDLLSLRMLGAIARAVEDIKKKKPEFNLDEIPCDDEKTYELLRSAKTIGCFQLESPGMRQLLGKLQPRNFDDIVNCISLFRPGPMQADMVSPFLARRWNKEEVKYLYPSLEPILKDTYGVIIFHEQVLRIAQVMAGFSLGQADLLRRSMTEKISDEDKKNLRQSFLSGCERKGIDGKIAEKIFDQLSAFGAFGFCKAHAVSFAKIAYQSAYLKTHYPGEFFLGVLNNEPGLYPPRVILNEAKRFGIRILPPDINKSFGEFSLEENTIRVGLSQVRNMGPTSLREILEKRRKKVFESLEDFCIRVKIERSLLENLILCGCFNSLNGKRINSLQISRILDQLAQNSAQSKWKLPKIPSLNTDKKAALEMDLLGLTLTSHPLCIFKKSLNGIKRIGSGGLSRMGEGEKVKVAGIRVILHTPPTRSGKRVVFLTMEDEDGLIDVTIFPSTQEDCSRDIFEADFLLIEGFVQKHGSAVSVIANKVFDLGKM